MKYLLAILSLGLLPLLANGQRINDQFLLQRTSQSTSFTVVNDETGAPFRIEPRAAPASSTAVLGDLTFTLRGPDLLLAATTPKAKFSGLNYALSATITGPLGQTQHFETAIVRAGKKVELSWADALEKGWYPSGNYTVEIEQFLIGDVDCAATAPRFSLNRLRLASALTTFVGIGLVGVGQVKLAEADNAYGDYLGAWAAGEANTPAVRETFTRATEAQEIGQTVANVGGALAVAGGATLLLQWLQNRKQMSIRKTYCGQDAAPSLSLMPAGIGPNGTVQLGLTLRQSLH